MLSEEPYCRPDLASRVDAALDYMGNDGEDLAAHCTWMLCQLLNKLSPDDLTPQETMAVVAVLAPAHARKLTTVGDQRHFIPGRNLRLIAPLRTASGQRGTVDAASPDA